MKIQGALAAPFAEVREMANIIAIESLRNSVLNNLDFYPQNIYLYGHLQAWLLSFLPDDFNLLYANRICSIVALLLSVYPLLLIIRIFQPKVEGIVLSLVIFAYLYPHVVDFPLTLGTPNYLGLFFSNLILYFCIKQSRARFITIPVCLICCFLTKQYHLFSFCYPLCALLFYKREKFSLLNFFAIILLTGIGIYICMTHIQTQYSIQHHLLVRGGTSKRMMVDKYLSYMIKMTPILWLVFIAFLRQHLNVRPRIERSTGSFEFNINFLRAQRRPFPLSNFIFYLSILCCSLVVMIRMGQHQGAIGDMYYAQLLTPSLVVFSLFYSSSIGIRRSDIVIACILFVFIMVKPLWYELNKDYSYSRDSNIVMNDLKNHHLKVRGSALTSYMQKDLNIEIDDNGQTQYTEMTYPKSGEGERSMLQHKAMQYRLQLVEKIEKQYYDVIYTDFPSYLQPANFPILARKYDCDCEIMISQGWSVKRWIPKQIQVDKDAAGFNPPD